ncbi:MAG: hypothetical protein JWM64_1198 [Frankiales bacterium]|nr:hypothetical protein [Frankiales bacterium]
MPLLQPRALLVGLLVAVPLAVPLSTVTAAGAATGATTAVAVPVSVTSTSSYTDLSGTFVHVVGEVRNDATVVALKPTLTYELLDGAGAVLVRGSGQTGAKDLAPGETTSFQVPVRRPEGYASTRIVSVVSEQGSEVSNTAFAVAVSSVTPTGTSGTVRNTGPAPASTPFVDLVHVDPSGVVYDVDGVFAGGDPAVVLAPGATLAWSVARRENGQPFREGTVVRTRASSSTPPSPYPTTVTLTATRKVVAGQSAVATARIVGRGTNGGIPDERSVVVELYGREAGQTALRLLRRAQTTSSFLQWSLEPQRDLRLEARVVAGPGVTASVSPQSLTQVAYAVTSAGVTPNGPSAVLRADVRPAAPSAVVQLQELRSGVWRGVQSTRLSSRSRAAFSVRRAPGRYAFRVVKPAGAGVQAGTGPRTTVSFTR